MRSFLDHIADELLSRDGNDLSDLCVVLPNRRAGVFLRDALSRAGKRTIWAPNILSIEDFVFRIAGVVKIEQVSLLFKLFDVYSKTVVNHQSFEDFANWGATFLADINEVDMNLVDAQEIYTELYSVERIARWNPSGRPMSDFQQRHLEFVKGLFPLYASLRAQLKQENLAYQGLAFRNVADNIASSVANCPWGEVWFAGFNALTVSEEHILRGFSEQTAARIYWDMDVYYADDPLHEAGHYYRRYASGRSHLKLTGDEKWKFDHFTSSAKDVFLVSAQRGVAQAEAAASLISQKMKNDGAHSLSKVAVVLNDEKLLFPLLNALPEDLTGVNITMGYGLRYSQTVSFIEKLFQLHINAAKHGHRFYNLDLLQLSVHPVYRSASNITLQTVKTSLIKLKKTYLTSDDVLDLGFDARFIGRAGVTVPEFLAHLAELCVLLRKNWSETDFRVELGFVVLIERVVRRLRDLQQEHPLIDSVKTLHVFWRQLINGQQLDFVGEPIGGLQIMGMLETRNLDFEEVIMLSVNEGSLPSGSHHPSYFTFDVRRAFGLACQNERDAVTAYHFYRLIQRAKKVHLIFDTDTESFGGGEVSRYVQQLRLEAGAKLRFHDIRATQQLPKSHLGNPIVIEKNESVVSRLRSLAQKGFSPSALNTYRACAFKFYLRYVAEFGEQDEITEDIDHAVFGTAVHNCLEELYTPIVGEQLDTDRLQGMLADLEQVLMSKFAEKLPQDSVLQGTNLLAYQVATMYAERVIHADLESVAAAQPYTILQLEADLTGSLDVSVNGTPITVRLKGKADRIDRTAKGKVRVIDYKTGSAKNKKFEISSRSEFGQSDSDHAFQLLLYQLMYAQMNEGADSVPSIYFLRLKEVEKQLSVMDEKMVLTGGDLVNYTNELLSELLEELLNQEIPFEQTTREKNCEYCEFISLCQRD